MPYREAVDVIRREVLGAREAAKDASRRFGYAHRAVLADRGAAVEALHDRVLPFFEGEIESYEQGSGILAGLQELHAAYQGAIARAQPFLVVAPLPNAHFWSEEVPFHLRTTRVDEEDRHDLTTTVPIAIEPFELRPQRSTDGIFRHDVRIGARYFDESFWIKGDAGAATAALCDPTQESLLSIIDGAPSLVFGRGLVTLTCSTPSRNEWPAEAIAALVAMRRALTPPDR